MKTSLLSKSNIVGFLGISSTLFQTFARKTEMEWQIIVRPMMVFRFLRKTDCKRVNWATRKQRTWNFIFAGISSNVKSLENV